MLISRTIQVAVHGGPLQRAGRYDWKAHGIRSGRRQWSECGRYEACIVCFFSSENRRAGLDYRCRYDDWGGVWKLMEKTHSKTIDKNIRVAGALGSKQSIRQKKKDGFSHFGPKTITVLGRFRRHTRSPAVLSTRSVYHVEFVPRLF